MMEIRKLDREHLKLDNGLVAQRLMPWSLVNAPFEGSWCVVRPGAESGAHGHHEYEIWVAMSGESHILTEDGETPFVAGDIVHFTPHERHQVVNRGQADFEFYAIWWDAELAGKFAVRHQEST
ncbi:cupin domain-containing protein [Saccharothrix sp. NRRL B-16348]|uniref:cupin domain-containing protein n=1 Tax=Saccharothrix sp. NRRL B-16348 TaxID=1415542 RepID=UPI000AFC5177|nr:cupin domain-containing protein [Saccharothrix sp. NRRL B-16348]